MIIRKSTLTIISIIFGILNVKTQTLSDVKFRARYVDAANGKFYDSEFYVDFLLHPNVLEKIPNAIQNAQLAAQSWNDVSNSYLNFTISGTSSSSNEVIESLDGVNIIGFCGDDFPSDFRPGSESYGVLAYTQATMVAGQSCNN